LVERMKWTSRPLHPFWAKDWRNVYRDIPEDMRTMIEPIVADQGLELVDIERHQGRPPWTVRVIVDTASGDGRVPVERCADVSREIAAQLDAADAIPVRYQLEVTSPGLDRVLAREKDFTRACGREVRVETRAPQDGRRRFRGRLLAFDAGALRLSVDGAEVSIAFADVARARTVYEFTRDDFAQRNGGSGR
jgi:ribosome maturation factor RimP